MKSSKVSDFSRTRSWQKQHGGHLFRTFSSLEWFIRNHYGELIQSGEFIPRKGAQGSLVGSGFDQVVLNILRRETSNKEVSSC